jgi:TatD DNase family protein
MWTDSHCHDVRDAVLDEARAAGVGRFVTVGTDAASSRTCLEAALRHDDVWIVALLDEPRVVAIGECGLDYHYDHSPRDVQRVVFAAQVAIANERRIPLVIHTREAWDDTFDVLDAEGVPARTVFHCFTGGADEARRALDRGAILSFSGIVTFPSAEDLRDAARLCPLDRLLVETDSPYLAPVPHRGKRNEPSFVVKVAEAVGRHLGLSGEEVARRTTENARRFYGVA